MQLRAVIIVESVVPGFGFCFLVRYYARRSGLCGFVQYLPSGDAEVVVEGAREQIVELYRKIQTFPPGLNRRNVVLEWEAHSGEFTSFEVLYSALAARIFTE